MSTKSTSEKPVVEQVAEKLFEKVKNEANPKDYLKANFKDLMNKIRGELGFQKISEGAFRARYKDAQHKAGVLLYLNETKK